MQKKSYIILIMFHLIVTSNSKLLTSQASKPNDAVYKYWNKRWNNPKRDNGLKKIAQLCIQDLGYEPSKTITPQPAKNLSSRQPTRKSQPTSFTNNDPIDDTSPLACRSNPTYQLNNEQTTQRSNIIRRRSA